MAGVGGHHPAAGQVEPAPCGGHEHAGLVVAAELAADPGEDGGGRRRSGGAGAEQRLGDGHEQRRGHALPRDVPDQEPEAVAVHEEVVEVPAHGTCRPRLRHQLQLGPLGEAAGQHRHLDVVGQPQSLLDPLLLELRLDELRPVEGDPRRATRRPGARPRRRGVKTPPPDLFSTWITPSSFPLCPSSGAHRMERVRKSVWRSVSGLKRGSR